ncbi:sugar ABC transporter substrate-binding protein [Oricola indica]|uniref:sugar ABC transporter substrate-binding protein n=1 Tax=Oricola indica TaxID=2872591 RepID=UPI003CCB752F
MTITKLLAGAALAMTLMSGAAKAQDWLPEELNVPLSEITIGFSSLGAGVNSYVATYMDAFESYAAELGVNTVTLDSQADPARQSDQIRDLIAQQVDVMVIWPTNAVAVVPSVRAVHEAGIPVVITNSEIDETGADFFTTFTGPDDYTQAQTAGKLMAEGLSGEGKVVVIGGLPGYTVSQRREQGFRDAIAEYPGIEILDVQPGNWSREEAQSVMESYIVRFGDEIDGVYSADSDMGIGALAAVQAAVAEGTLPEDHEIVFTDCTLFGAAYDAIAAGDYYGSVLQSPIADARAAVEAAVLVAEGVEVEKIMHFDSPAVSAANISEIDRPTF